MEFNTLTLTLQNFIAAFSGGYARLAGPIHSLLAILVGIEILLLGLWSALGGGDNVVAVFKKILHIGLWVWLVQSFPTLSKAFVESLIDAGLMAGGGAGNDVSLIMDPSRIAGYGLDATQPLVQKIQDLGSFDIADLVVFGFGYLAIMACFLIMAINIFIAVLEYYLFVACVGILLPFGLVSGTKFLAEKAIGAVVATGIKLMVLSFVMAAIEPVIAGMHFKGPDIAMNELWAMFLSICAMTLLCWKAPHLASSVLSGSPSFGGSGLVGGAVAGASAAASLASAGQARALSSAMQATQAAAGGGPASSGAGTRGGAAAAPMSAAAPPQTSAAHGAAQEAGGSSSDPPPAADPTLVRSSGGTPPPAPPPTLVPDRKSVV